MDRRRQQQGRAAAAALSLAAHAGLLLAVLSLGGRAPSPLEEAPVMAVELVDLPGLIPSPAPVAQAKAAPARAEPTRRMIKPRPTPPRPAEATLPAPARDESRISEAQLAGAVTAGSGAGGGAGGSGGGVCDMPALVQTALRKDPLVRDAVWRSGGRAALVWNGDWVRSGQQDGKGLAAVREAILWAVGFAPKACRGQAVHGLVLLSVDAAGGPVRLAVGTAQWRWSDLLTPRGSAPDG